VQIHGAFSRTTVLSLIHFFSICSLPGLTIARPSRLYVYGYGYGYVYVYVYVYAYVYVYVYVYVYAYAYAYAYAYVYVYVYVYMYMYMYTYRYSSECYSAPPLSFAPQAPFSPMALSGTAVATWGSRSTANFNVA